MTYSDRLNEIRALTDALQCPALIKYLGERIQEHTLRLIDNDHEQTRGRIKALRALLTLPDELQYERAGIEAALSEQSDAA